MRWIAVAAIALAACGNSYLEPDCGEGRSLIYYGDGGRTCGANCSNETQFYNNVGCGSDGVCISIGSEHRVGVNPGTCLSCETALSSGALPPFGEYQLVDDSTCSPSHKRLQALGDGGVPVNAGFCATFCTTGTDCSIVGSTCCRAAVPGQNVCLPNDRCANNCW
jgi:hypothetical protein